VVEVLELVAKLYAVEHVAAEQGVLGTEAHRLLRAQRSHDIVDAIDAWVDAREGKFGPKTNLGKALTYANNHRKALRRFLADPKLPLDNNIAERALRIFALGRKNFLFAGHDDAAQNIAVLQSMVSTCALHGVNPYLYIRDVLLRIHTHPANDLEAIMPWRWDNTVAGNDEQIDSGKFRGAPLNAYVAVTART
jgi:transposase